MKQKYTLLAKLLKQNKLGVWEVVRGGIKLSFVEYEKAKKKGNKHVTAIFKCMTNEPRSGYRPAKFNKKKKLEVLFHFVQHPGRAETLLERWKEKSVQRSN